MLYPVTAFVMTLGVARLSQAAAADDIDFFSIGQSNNLFIDNSATHQIGTGQYLPACEYEGFGQARSDEALLTIGQWDCNLPAPNYFSYVPQPCDGGDPGHGKPQIDIYRTTDDIYDAYCAGGDGSIIGQCYYRCSSKPCSGPLNGGVAYNLLNCYFSPCQCV